MAQDRDIVLIEIISYMNMQSENASDYDTGSEIDDPEYDPNNNVFISGGCGGGGK